MADPIQEEAIRKLEEIKKNKEEELKKILEEIRKKSEEIKKLRNEEIKTRLEEELSKSAPKLEETIENESAGKDDNNSNAQSSNQDEAEMLYSSANQNSANTENTYSTSLSVMGDLYETVKDLYSASWENNLSAEEISRIDELQDKISSAENAYIPSKRALDILETSKSLLDKIKKYNV